MNDRTIWILNKVCAYLDLGFDLKAAREMANQDYDLQKDLDEDLETAGGSGA